MFHHDFNSAPEFEREGGLLRIIRGFDVAGLSDGREAAARTFVYSPEAGIMTVEGAEYLVPPRSVSVVDAGVHHSLKQRDSRMEGYVFEVSGEARVPIDGDEINNLIYRSPDGKLAVYTDDSRILPFNTSKRSGWFTHAHKDQSFGLSDAVWTEVRGAEILHAHQQVEEGYIVLDGVAHVQVGEDVVPVQKGELLVVQPYADLGRYEQHCVRSIDLGSSGKYWHLCYNNPSMPNDPNERVNFDAREGFRPE